MTTSEIITARVNARREADEVVGLISEVLDGMATDDEREAFWLRLSSIVPPSIMQPKLPDVIEPMTDAEAREFGLCQMKFGKHQGEWIDEVPLEYLLWLSEEKDEFKHQLRRYVKSRRVQAEQED